MFTYDFAQNFVRTSLEVLKCSNTPVLQTSVKSQDTALNLNCWLSVFFDTLQGPL